MLVALPGYATTVGVRRVEVDAGERASRLTVTRGWRSPVVPTADLRRVVVVERLQLHRQVGVTLMLSVSGGQVECHAGSRTSLGRVATQTFAGWPGEVFGPAGMPVNVRHWWKGPD